MKEIKEFIQELCDCAKPSANGSVVTLEDATRIVAHAFAADMVFKEYTYGESGEEPFCDVNALNRDFGDLRLKELINGKYR